MRGKKGAFFVTLLVLRAAQGILCKEQTATAEKILQARKSYDGFKSMDDLQAIRGIGQNLGKTCTYLTVGNRQRQGPNRSHMGLAAALASEDQERVLLQGKF